MFVPIFGGCLGPGFDGSFALIPLHFRCAAPRRQIVSRCLPRMTDLARHYKVQLTLGALAMTMGL
jgi:hypothetical protein